MIKLMETVKNREAHVFCARVEGFIRREPIGYSQYYACAQEVMNGMKSKIKKSEEEWRKALTPDEFHVLREKGTERSFTGKYVDCKKKGIYVCAGCGKELFSSDTKFDSGSGWPSFWAPVSEDSVNTKPDNSLGMHRTEALCSQCGGHLGHVFDDGPKPTGNRFCINSVALHLKEQKEVAGETEG